MSWYKKRETMSKKKKTMKKDSGSKGLKLKNNVFMIDLNNKLSSNCFKNTNVLITLNKTNALTSAFKNKHF